MKTKWLKIGAIICSPLLVIGFQNCAKLGTNGIAVDDKVLTLDGTQVVNDPAIPSTHGQAASDPSQPAIPPSASGSTESTNPNPDPGQSTQTNPQDIGLVTSEIPKNMNAEDEELDNEDENDEDEQEFESCDRDDKGKNNRGHSDGDKKHDDKKIAENKKDHEDFIIDDSIEALAPLIKGCNVDRSLSENAQEVDIKFDHESIDVDALNLKRLKGTMGIVTVRAATDSSEAKTIKVNHSVVVLCDFAEIKKIKGVHNHIVVVGGKIDTVKLNNSTLSLVNATIEKFKGTNTKVNTYSLK